MPESNQQGNLDSSTLSETTYQDLLDQAQAAQHKLEADNAELQRRVAVAEGQRRRALDLIVGLAAVYGKNVDPTKARDAAEQVIAASWKDGG